MGREWTDAEVRAVAARFVDAGEWRGFEPLGGGHIHDTLLATVGGSGEERRIVLQRLNARVFPDLAAVGDNLERIASHLGTKLRAEGVPDVERRVLHPLRDGEGRTRVVDAAGDEWRAFPFIADTRSHATAGTPAIAAEAARAFGEFAARLADLPGGPLAVTIPHFHDPPHRLAALDAVARDDAHGRARAVAAELDAARRGLATLDEAMRAAGAADAPIRSVHNDCKLDNVLFDVATDRALCVVDLDTAMPGTLAFDFGELVRSATCPAPEDETDLDRIELRLDLFEGCARGYLEGVGGLLAPSERAALPLAGELLTLENAVRFLTDHLAGDVYFRIHRPDHNLDRARAQLRLAERLRAARGEMAAIVADAAR